MQTQTLPLTPAEIAAIASIGAAAADAKARLVTPILGAVHVTATPATHSLTAAATDRYVATELTFTTANADSDNREPFTFQLDSKDWERLAKATAAKADARRVVTLTVYNTTTTNVIATWETGQTIGEFEQLVGNYPPVMRLFPDETRDITAGTFIDPAKIARATKAHTPAETTPAERKGLTWALAQSGSATQNTRPERAALVLTAHTHNGATLRALVQPNFKP